MRESIVCEGTTQLADAFDILLLHVKPRPVLAILGSALVILAVAACFLPARSRNGGTEAPSFTLPALLLFLALYAFVYVPWNLRRLYLQNPMKELPRRCEAAGSGLMLSSERGETRLLWSDFRRWRSNRRVLLLYVTEASFLAFPAHLFTTSGTYVEFQALVARQLGKPT